MQASQRGRVAPVESRPRHILHSGSTALTVIPSPTSINSISAPSVRPYFFPQLRRYHDSSKLVNLSHNFSIKQKVRPPKQTHKNANSDSRQTNLLILGIPAYTKLEFAFCQIHILCIQKRSIPIPNPKRKPYLLCIIQLVWHYYYTTFFAVCKKDF